MKARLSLGVAALIGAVGCDVTTEITKAPLELTSAVVRPTSEFTSSTTPGAAAVSPHAKARRQLETFAAYSYDDVRADIARGEGEYLVSLAALAGVPADAYSVFQAEMQRRYAAMYEPNASTTQTWSRVVQAAWSAGHGRVADGQR
jgi:hypothetical protein